MEITIHLNNQLTELPVTVTTVSQLITWQKSNPATTAVAINNHLVKRQNWDCTTLKNEDKVTLISAAFGG